MTTQLRAENARDAAEHAEAPPQPAVLHSDRGLRQSLRGKILVRALAIALIPLMLIGFITLGSLLGLSRTADQTLESERQQLGNEVAGQRLRTEARAVAQELDGFLHERISDVTGWASDPTITEAAIAAAAQSQPYAALPDEELEEQFADTKRIGSTPTVRGFLAHQLEREEAFSSVFFTERNGFNVTGTDEVDDFAQRDEEWWIATQIRGLHFGQIEYDGNQYSLPLSARVKNPKSGEGFGGVLQARLGVEMLQQVAARNAGLEGRQATIITGDGLLLAETGSDRTDERIMREGVTFSEGRQAAVDAALASSEPGFLVHDEAVVGYAPLSSVRDRPGGTATDINAFRGIDANPINWVVLIEQPTEFAFAELNGLTVVRQSLNRTAVQLSALGIVALVLAVIAAIMVSSRLSARIVQPLLSLRRAAYDISERQLPELVEHVQRAEGDEGDLPAVPAVEVGTDDEVEDVADAFNVVRDTAVHLAAEQARSRRNASTMFVNLGRRNQGLLRKQLEFIDELERDEADTRLREILFRLDHLATRMRRNAESLLVLAGEPTPRLWNRPIPLIDVVRSAIGEVEEYQRVDARDIDDVRVTGQAASDLAHLLAELIENATNFSPPDTTVEVIGWRVSEGYALSIVDDGIGMTPEELEEANGRLRSAPSLHRVPSNYLGLFVVGRLASRYGISVRLGESAAEGVVAKVMLPGNVVTQDTPQHMTPAHGIAGVPAQGSSRSDGPPPTPAAPAAPPPTPAAEPPADPEIAASGAAGHPPGGPGVVRRRPSRRNTEGGRTGGDQQPSGAPLRVGMATDQDAGGVDNNGADIDDAVWSSVWGNDFDDNPDASTTAEIEARKARERLGGYQRAVRDGRAALSSKRDHEPRDAR